MYSPTGRQSQSELSGKKTTLRQKGTTTSNIFSKVYSLPSENGQNLPIYRTNQYTNTTVACCLYTNILV